MVRRIPKEVRLETPGISLWILIRATESQFLPPVRDSSPAILV